MPHSLRVGMLAGANAPTGALAFEQTSLPGEIPLLALGITQKNRN